MSDFELPLLDAIERQLEFVRTRLHVPGHAGRPPIGRLRRLAAAYQMDFTELPGLDDLAWPTGPLRELERRIAAAYHADDAALSVGGSSLGLMAAVFAHVRPGEGLSLIRAAHRSIYHGLALSGGRPEYLPVTYDRELGYPIGWADFAPVTSTSVAVAPFPTYPGAAFPLRPAGLSDHLIIADAAHGAMFGLNEAWPATPLEAGADLAVIGTHKTSTSLTQTAVVVWRGPRVDGWAVRRALRVLGTSSPSYLLLLSLEADQAWRETCGEKNAARLAKAIRTLERSDLGRIWRPSGMYDPARLVLRAPEGGSVLAAHLRALGLEPEHVDAYAVWLVLGIGLRTRDFAQLRRVLVEVGAPAQAEHVFQGEGVDVRPDVAFPLADALRRRPGRWLSLEEAVGQPVADFVVPYPPGVPMVLPGEVLGWRELQRIQVLRQAGSDVHGVSLEGKIRVLDEAPRNYA